MDKFSKFRNRAEDVLKKSSPSTIEETKLEKLALLNELDTYRIELELQYKELDQTNQQLKITYDKLKDTHYRHFEVAPVGYVTLDQKNKILDSNLTFPLMLGLTKTKLLHHHFTDFINDADQDSFYLCCQALVQSQAFQYCELRLKHKIRQAFWVKLDCVYELDNNSPIFQITISDITQQKLTEEKLQKNYDYLESIFRVAPVGIGLVKERILKEVNEKLCEMTGYSREELINQNSRLLYPCEDDYNFVGVDKYQQISKTGTGTVNTRWKCKNGDIIDVLLSSTPLDINDFSKGVTFTALDISEQKKTQRLLQKEKNKYLSLFDNSPDMYLNLDIKTSYVTECNQTLIDKLGFTKEEIVGQSVFNLYTADSASYAKKYVLPVFKKEGQISNEQLQIQRKDGQIIDVSLNVSAVYDEQGNIIGSCSTWRDISEKKQLHVNLERYKGFFEHAPQPYQALDKNGYLLETNAAWRRVLGYEADELKHQWFGDLLPAKTQKIFINNFQKLKSKNKIHGLQLSLKHKQGHLVEILVDGKVVRDEQGKFIQTQCILTDISKKRKINAQLKLFRQQIDQSKDAVYVVDYVTSQFLDVNQSACTMLGYSRKELLNKGVIDISAFTSTMKKWQDLARIEKNSINGMIMEDEHLNHKGKKVPVEVSTMFQISNDREIFVTSVRDLTERKQAEKQQRLNQQNYEHILNLEIVNQTVAAIAHELNQPLTASTSFADAALNLLQAKELDKEKLSYALEQNMQQTHRAGQVTHELFKFIQTGNTVMEHLNINTIIDRVIHILEEDGELGLFKIIYKQDESIPTVKVNALQLEKVLLNVIRNAIEAMQDAELVSGRIFITIERNDRSSCVQVNIHNQGPAIGKIIAQNIFEPFFSSKAGGVGMGLAISRAIIEAQGGHLWCQAEESNGTTFQLTLPYVKEDSE